MIKKLDIDWDWVKSHVIRSERLANPGASGSKDMLLSDLEECLNKSKELARPRFVFCEKKISCLKKDGIELEGGVTLSGKSLVTYTKGARSVCIFLVTIGDRIEEAATALMKEGEHLKGYLFDRIASFAVESLAEQFEEAARKYYKARDKGVSMRFSPGYCDWPLEEQFTLTKILDFSKAGVTLTENCMMVPKKSISAMTAIGPKELFKKKISQCSICDKVKACDYRRI